MIKKMEWVALSLFLEGGFSFEVVSASATLGCLPSSVQGSCFFAAAL